MIYDKVAEVLLKMDGLSPKLYEHYGNRPVCNWMSCKARRNLIMVKYYEERFIHFACKHHIDKILDDGFTLYE